MNTPLNLINFASSKSLIGNLETPRIQYYSSSSNQEYEKDESEILNELNDNKKNKKEENKEIIKENETVKTQADTALLNPEIQNLRIVNVVSMVDLGCQLNLSDIAKSCKNSEYTEI